MLWYKALMKSNNENIKSLENKDKTKYEGDSEIIRDNNRIDFPEKIGPAIDYKRRSIKKESVKLEKNSKIIPPPGLPEKSDIPHPFNGQQRGEGSKPDWLCNWQGKF